MSRVAVFGGTTEGRELGVFLAGRGVEVELFVATEYGEDTVPPMERLAVTARRMDADEMAARLGPCDLVVDATHPYARQVTLNIAAACEAGGRPYLRLIREEWRGSGVLEAATAVEAAELLSQLPGRALLTVGSKELAAFTAVPGWQERLVARVLPSVEVLEKCAALGFHGRSLICMQGPFSHAMNAATIRDLGIGVLVTKDSGEVGGLWEKLSAAEETGTVVIVIRRPVREEGLPLEAMLRLLSERLHLPPPEKKTPPPLPRFPLFISLEGRPVQVIGGGAVATRRVKTLLGFGGAVTVTAPAVTGTLRALAEKEAIIWRREAYCSLPQAALAVAATDDREVNRRVGEDARALGIPVSVADCKEESTFWFPAVVWSGNAVAGITSSNGDHHMVKKIAGALRQVLEEQDK